MISCPSREQLARLLAEQLVEPESSRIEAHLETCASCQGVLAELCGPVPLALGQQQLPGQTMPYAEPRSGFLRRLRQAVRGGTTGPAAGETPLPEQTPACASAGTPTSTGLRFQVLRPLARGGLGEVLVARDAEVPREVALKQMQERYADHAASRARFVREAEVTGALEHPGVVPVYGLGAYPDGRPYYAMRLIRGESLQEAIRRFHRAHAAGREPGERLLSLRQLLGRFLAVCNALAYAHSRGVIHRDLKPANVMLGDYGETLVVDWGLAKVMGKEEPGQVAPESPSFFLLPPSSLDLTQAGQALGTPSYMSPEQAGGRLDLLTPASDVYGLGATLYCLLTGRAPVAETSDVGAMLRQVERGDFPSARQRDPRVPAALDAVCRKAMARRQEDRYASARALADDVEHWLADEPVSAYREPLRIRTGRWARRHPALVAASAATLLVAALAAGSGAWWFDLQRRHAVALQGRAEAGEALASTRLEEVAQQKQRTEAEAAIARAVNDFLQLDLLGQADIANQPFDREVAQRNPNITVAELLDRASKRIEGRFAAEPATEAAIRMTLGSAYKGLGRYPEAKTHLERSVRLRTDHLGADDPLTLKSQNELALLYHEHGKDDQAEPLFREVIDRSTARLGADHLDTLSGKNNLAMVYMAQGKHHEAETLYKEVIDAQTVSLGADHPRNLRAKNNLAIVYKNEGKLDQAEALYRAVLAGHSAQLGADHPFTLRIKINLAGLYLAQGKYHLAEPLFRELIDTQTAKQGANHPDTLICKGSLARVYQAQGKYDRAEPLYQEALDGQTARLGADHPHTLTTKNNLAGLYREQRKYDRAEPLFKDVLNASIAKLGANHPETLASKNDLAAVYKDLRQYDRAEVLFKEVLDAHTARLAADHPDVLVAKNNLATVYYAQGKYDRAEPLMKEVLEAQTARHGADHPLALISQHNLGSLYQAQRKYDRAEPLLREAALGIRKKLGLAHPTTQQFLGHLIGCYEEMAQPARAEPLLRELADFSRQRAGPDSLPYAGQLAVLGFNLLRQKKGTEAEAVLRPCLAIRQQKEAEAWTTFNTQSLLGGALLLQKKYADAEPLLIQGYEGLKYREAQVPAAARSRLSEALERLVQLYDAWDKKDQAEKWRKKLAEARAAEKKP
jgi:non-specific serine/threonine protein kinase/serine/threonine-protein kinase